MFVIRAHPVKEEVHCTQSGNVRNQVDPMESLSPKERSLLRVITPSVEVLKNGQQEPTGAACGIGNPHHLVGSHHFYNGAYDWPWREVLASATSNIVSVSGQQPLIYFALHVNVEPGPILAVNHLD